MPSSSPLRCAAVILGVCAAAVPAGAWADGADSSGLSPLYSFAHDILSRLDPKAGPELGNHVAIIDHPHDSLLLRVHLIQNARRSIDIQTFILDDDECARLLMYELIQAAKRGVKVRLLTDHLRSTHNAGWMTALTAADPNFELRFYRPAAKSISPGPLRILLNFLLYFRGSNQRMHNKVMIFDEVLALIGGRNIDNHYFGQSTTYNFLDRDVLVTGPVIEDAQDSFEKYWKYRRSIPSTQLRDVRRRLKNKSYDPCATHEDFRLGDWFDHMDARSADQDLIRSRFVDTLMAADTVHFIADSPGKNRSVGLWGGGQFTRRIREIIRESETSLVIQSPYLILDGKMRRAFRKLRRLHRDVEISIVTNSYSSTENAVAYAGNYKLRANYIEALGFRIYELKPHPDDLPITLPNFETLSARAQTEGRSREPFLSVHSKSFVVDGHLSYIGSYNFHPRSDNLDTEVGLLIEDAQVAADLERRILADTLPDSSWVIAKTEFPLSDINYLFEGLSGLTPVDIWPLRNTTSYDLRPGCAPVPPDHPEFYDRYKDAGSFPGAEGISTKEITTHIYRILGTIAIPIL